MRVTEAVSPLAMMPRRVWSPCCSACQKLSPPLPDGYWQASDSTTTAPAGAATGFVATEDGAGRWWPRKCLPSEYSVMPAAWCGAGEAGADAGGAAAASWAEPSARPGAERRAGAQASPPATASTARRPSLSPRVMMALTSRPHASSHTPRDTRRAQTPSHPASATERDEAFAALPAASMLAVLGLLPECGAFLSTEETELTQQLLLACSVEGVELHLLCMTIGVGIWPPQLKLPLLPGLPWGLAR